MSADREAEYEDGFVCGSGFDDAEHGVAGCRERGYDVARHCLGGFGVW